MVQCMLHDPSYSRGTYYAPELGCYLGWTHARRDRMRTATLSWTIGGSRADFLRRTLRSRRGSSRPSTPRCLLKQYIDVGASVRRSTSMDGSMVSSWIAVPSPFSCSTIDSASAACTYHQSKGVFTFASEAKAVLSVRPDARSIRPGRARAIPRVRHRFWRVDALFERVPALPAASCWSVDRTVDHHEAALLPSADLDRAAAAGARGVLHGASQHRLANSPELFRASLPVGLSLTGGLDTRIVMAGMPSDAGALKSYTYGGAYRDCYDVGVAREVAAACGRPHQVIPLGEDFFESFSTLAEQTVWLTDGCLDICGTHEIYYSRSARAVLADPADRQLRKRGSPERQHVQVQRAARAAVRSGRGQVD